MMDVLEQFLGGGKTTTPSAPSSVITDQILDRLKMVESSGDPYALNKESKAMGAYQFMPEQVQTMHKQGIEFNPFNEKESRQAAKTYLEKLVKEKGSVEKALAAYGGFVTKDPTAYVNKVLQAPTAPQAKAPQAQQQTAQATSSDPLEAFFSGKESQAAPVAQPTQPTAPTPQQVITEQPQQGGSAVGRMAGQLLGRTQQAKQDLGASAASLADVTLGGIIPGIAGPVTYAGARFFGQSPEQAAALEQKVVGATEKPFGKALGVTETQAYKGEASRQLMDFIGQNINKGAEWIAQKTGLPVGDVQNMIGTATVAAAPAVGKVASTTAKAVQEVVPAIGKKLGVGELQVQRPGGTAAEAQAQFQAMQAKPGSAGAAKVEFNPYAGQITGEESARGQFPQVKLSKTAENVPVTEQATRAQIANEILGDTGQVRPGVVTGNENTLRNEHTKAKMANPTPEGELYKQQIANEQVALSNYAQKRVENTGASPSLVTPYERGQRINDAFAGDDGLAGFFKGEKKKLYDDVTSKVGDNPIQTSNVENLFADKQFKAGLGLKGNEGVARSAEELINLAKTVGFKDEMGNVYAPNSVNGWVAVQKALNSNWTKDNAGIIRQINQAIERDIGAAGGLDLLKKADSLHQAEKTLFGSKGIKQIFGDIDPNGVQTATAFDAIPQKLNSMPLDQWKHIYDTAEKVAKGTIDGPVDKTTGLPKWSVQVPEELRVSAQSAMNEMRGNIAREIYQAGAAKAGEWNQNAVNKILNARADKIKVAFSPEEQKAFHTLNVGGYLMPGVHGYEGAGQQMRRVGLIEGNLEKAGAATGASIGGAIAGAPGAAVGGYYGGKAGASAAGKMEAKALQKQATKSQQEMQKAAQLGKQTGQNKLSDLGK
jgi:hypothetical protein